MMRSLMPAYGLSLAIQLVHLILCVVWNGVGLWQKANGLQSIGPTASGWGVVLSIGIGCGLALLLRKSREFAYLVLSVVPFLMAVLTIYGGFTKDPSHWPSEFWRWAGIAVNAVGVIGFLLAGLTFTRGKQKHA